MMSNREMKNRKQISVQVMKYIELAERYKAELEEVKKWGIGNE